MNELVSFKNIFKDKIFKIPDYQRKEVMLGQNAN